MTGEVEAHLIALTCSQPPDGHDQWTLRLLAKRLFGKLVGDRGYIDPKLVAQLFESYNLHLVTFRANMKGRLLHQADVLLLRKRAIMETINDQLKNISQIEHSRHRSPLNFVVNLLAGLLAYCLQPKKPSLHLHEPLLLSAA